MYNFQGQLHYQELGAVEVKSKNSDLTDQPFPKRRDCELEGKVVCRARTRHLTGIYEEDKWATIICGIIGKAR